ncbi:putative nuclease HARBI1 [Macadamia integrifolia]|uniref:putative nuclease HARBI1 n=1 Tax=Macadamia integrifolia TaxID=60698 RepID=UPI001C52B6B4|nr:putative nuclease HARBI1 [Macadamia integrifolia]
MEFDDGYKRRRKIIIFAATAVVIAVDQYIKKYLKKEPYRCEPLRGIIETERIIGHTDKTCREQIRLSKRAFFSLSHLIREKGLLRDSRSVQVNEQLVMFLQTVGHNVKNRVIAHKFGHSGETVSRYFNLVLGAIIKLYPILLKPPSVAVHHRITSNEGRFYPYFKDCIGAIDGSHIPAWVHLSDHPRFRDRKGDISQNILAACDFDMKYTYILSGWEGSASDARILDNALHRDGDGKLVLPRGKYYFVDAGYANQQGFLRPYRNVRYHLKEWRNIDQSPSDKKELFNLRHSQLRNVIERSFGLLKSRFKILKNQPEYPFKTQARIVLACVLLHNHILTQNNVEEEER